MILHLSTQFLPSLVGFMANCRFTSPIFPQTFDLVTGVDSIKHFALVFLTQVGFPETCCDGKIANEFGSACVSRSSPRDSGPLMSYSDGCAEALTKEIRCFIRVNISITTLKSRLHLTRFGKFIHERFNRFFPKVFFHC